MGLTEVAISTFQLLQEKRTQFLLEMRFWHAKTFTVSLGSSITYFKEKETKSFAAENCYKHLPKATAESAASAHQRQTPPRGVWDQIQHTSWKKQKGEKDFALLQLPSAWHFAGWKQPVSTCGQPRKHTASPSTPVTRTTVCWTPRTLHYLPAGFSLFSIFFFWWGGCWESESPDYNLYESP